MKKKHIDTGIVRAFSSGATRDTGKNKLAYEGFLSPIVLKRFAQYMNRHRIQTDGSLRSADNWQKGIPKDVYIDSLFRHFVDVWLLHRGFKIEEKYDIQEALCAMMFNTMGYLFEELIEKEGKRNVE